jgi:3-oxoacyl-ACP reductase-like protein
MGLFQDLMAKIFQHDTRPSTSPPPTAAAAPAPTAAPAAAAAPATTAPAAVDVTAILDGLANDSSQKLDWRHSIVDLMKLVGMDSSLAARKALAAELHFTGDTSDSAKMNIWLHKQVLQKLSENGGHVPQELLS